MDGRHKNAVGEVAKQVELLRNTERALAESEEKRSIAEKSLRISETTLDALK